MTKFSTETIVQIWNDECGERIEFGSDADGLDLCEIRQYTDDGKVSDRIILHPIQAALLFNAGIAWLAANRRESVES